MENIPSFYADKMHDQNLRPYSQFTDFSDGTNIWTISSLNHEAYDNIIKPVLKLTTAKVRHNNDILTFEKPLIISLTYEQLLAESYSSGKKTDICVLEFITPTAFKSSGSYVILPSLRLIFLSLTKRFDAFFGIGNNDYESLAVEIERSITVSDYKLSGASFSLEGIRLPSFTGNIKIRIKGDEQFISYCTDMMIYELKLYALKLRVQRNQFDSGILSSKMPIYFCLQVVTFSFPRSEFSF